MVRREISKAIKARRHSGVLPTRESIKYRSGVIVDRSMITTAPTNIHLERDDDVGLLCAFTIAESGPNEGRISECACAENGVLAEKLLLEKLAKFDMAGDYNPVTGKLHSPIEGDEGYVDEGEWVIRSIREWRKYPADNRHLR